MATAAEVLRSSIIKCQSCSRLIKYCANVAVAKKRAYIAEPYWGKPVPGFGDTHAQLLIVGLAPAAHGANRTGRMFTGDRSGEWLYRALFKAGFANQAGSTHQNDGLALKNAYVTSVVKCAPPQNKPQRSELENCSQHLKRELQLLKEAKVVLVLGQIALQGVWSWVGQGKRPRFKHGSLIDLPNQRKLIMTYHPSQQNTFTRRLTEPMFDDIFKKAINELKSTL